VICYSAPGLVGAQAQIQQGLVDSVKDMGIYIRNLISEKRASPTDDFISRLCAAGIDDVHLSDSHIHSFITAVFGAGFETTSDAMSVMLLWLAQNPDGPAALKENPALLPTGVEEFYDFPAPHRCLAAA
jgi:cytochrome P450